MDMVGEGVKWACICYNYHRIVYSGLEIVTYVESYFQINLWSLLLLLRWWKTNDSAAESGPTHLQKVSWLNLLKKSAYHVLVCVMYDSMGFCLSVPWQKFTSYSGTLMLSQTLFHIAGFMYRYVHKYLNLAWLKYED